MRASEWFFRLATGVLAGVPALAPAQQPAAPAPAAPARFTVAGQVVDQLGERITGAQLRLASRPGAPPIALTGADGTFQLVGLPAGGDVLLVRRLGFAADTVPFQIPLPPRVPLTVALTPVAQPLAPVLVRASARDYRGPFAEFNRRRDRGFGTFVTRAEITRRRPSRVSDIFRTVNNMRVERSGSLNVIRMRGRSCDPLVWVDGVPLVGGFPDLDAVAPSSLEGIEIYSGVATIPPELIGPRDAGGCGVIVLWSRHGEPNRKKPRKPVSPVELAALVDGYRIFTADQVDTPAQPAPGSQIDPAYPEPLRAGGVPGRVRVEFIVDVDGTVERETIGVVSASNAEFADAVRESVPDARFLPAVRMGKPGLQLVQLTIRFAPAGTGDGGTGPAR